MSSTPVTRKGRARHLRVAEPTMRSLDDEMAALQAAPSVHAPLRAITSTINRARLGRHGHMPTGAVIANAAAFRAMRPQQPAGGDAA